MQLQILSARKDQISVAIQVSVYTQLHIPNCGPKLTPLCNEARHNFYVKTDSKSIIIKILSAVTFLAITYSKCNNPRRLQSTVYDTQMLLQPQLISYEEHSLCYLLKKIIVVDYKLS
jgi:hypothetical protein